MKLLVGVTDSGWFTFLSGQTGLDEVNFWQPNGNNSRLLRDSYAAGAYDHERAAEAVAVS